MKSINVLHAELGQSVPKPAATAGTPHEANLVIADHGTAEVGVWECTPGVFPSRQRGQSETMCFLAGRGVLRSDDGSEAQISAGVVIHLPEGWTGTWEIEETVRKVYTVVVTSAPSPIA